MNIDGTPSWKDQVASLEKTDDLDREILLARVSAAVVSGQPLEPELAQELRDALGRGIVTARAVDDSVAFAKQVNDQIHSLVAKIRRLGAYSAKSLKERERDVKRIEGELRQAREDLDAHRRLLTVISSNLAHLDRVAAGAPAFFGGAFNAQEYVEHLASIDGGPDVAAVFPLVFPSASAGVPGDWSWKQADQDPAAK